MKKFIASGEKKCLFHWFKLKFNKENNLYSECRCGARKVIHPKGGGPVRFNWLDGKTNRVVKSSQRKDKE